LTEAAVRTRGGNSSCTEGGRGYAIGIP
jgi:hypothetical protein